MVFDNKVATKHSIDMTLEGVLRLCEMNKISQELYYAARDWLINPNNFIPTRTVNHALSLFESKVNGRT